MTCGAAASLCITFKALAEKDDEVIIFAPYFPEYKVFINAAGAKTVEVKCNEEDLTINLEALKMQLTSTQRQLLSTHLTTRRALL
jgi:aspartate aminotransferase